MEGAIQGKEGIKFCHLATLLPLAKLLAELIEMHNLTHDGVFTIGEDVGSLNEKRCLTWVVPDNKFLTF